MKTHFSLFRIFIGILLIMISSCSHNAILQNDYIIDKTRVGNILLCDKIDNLKKVYSNTKDTIIEGDEDVSWKADIIRLSQNEWCLVEASWTDSSRIWRITTNSKKFKTVDGVCVGDSISIYKSDGYSIDYFEGGIESFDLTTKNMKIGFSIEQVYADTFYKKTYYCNHCPEHLNFLDNKATLQTITISGNCK